MTEEMPQHMKALKWANEVRLGQAALRRELKVLPRIEGQERLAEIVEATEDPIVLRARIGYLYESLERIGPNMARRRLKSLDLKPETTLGELSQRQRDLLALALRQNGSPPRYVGNGNFVMAASTKVEEMAPCRVN